MTPEERAEVAAATLHQWKGRATKFPETLEIIAAAIRDAVKAEREACLRIIEHPNAGLEPPDGGDPTPDEMLANIAADIRERPL